MERHPIPGLRRLDAHHRRPSAWRNSEYPSVVFVPTARIGNVKVSIVIEDGIIWKFHFPVWRAIAVQTDYAMRIHMHNGLMLKIASVHIVGAVQSNSQ